MQVPQIRLHHSLKVPHHSCYQRVDSGSLGGFHQWVRRKYYFKLQKTEEIMQMHLLQEEVEIVCKTKQGASLELDKEELSLLQQLECC